MRINNLSSRVLIRKIITFLRSVIYSFYIWRDLFRSIIFNWGSNKIKIFHVEPWQYGWDLVRRRRLYIEILGREEVLIINLKSIAQVAIVNFLFSGYRLNSAEESNIRIREDILRRGIWDEKIKAIPVGKIYQNEKKYLDERDIAINSDLNLNGKRYEGVQKLLLRDRVVGIILIQEAYFELWLSAVVFEFDKFVIYPESEFGYIKVKNFDVSSKAAIYNDIFKKMDPIFIDKAKSSLENRFLGNVKDSSLRYYADAYKFGDNQKKWVGDCKSYSHAIIFFMHTFTDSPCYGVLDDTDIAYADHFDFCLKFFKAMQSYRHVKLYLRFHPQSKYFPYDSGYIKNVDELISNNSNIEVIPDSITVGEIFKSIPLPLVALSGYGSVTLECAFGGIKVYNYKRSIYTELGVAIKLDDLEQIIAPNFQVNPSLNTIAVNIEAARLACHKANLFDYDNFRQRSENIVLSNLGSLGF